jgi:simple sugar transport system permease protein
MTQSTTAGAPPQLNRNLLYLQIGGGILLALLFGFVLTIHLLGPGFTSFGSIATASAKPVFVGVLAMNCLIGISIFLFVSQFGRETIRVLLTIAVALLIGYILIRLISTDADKAYASLLTSPLGRINRWAQWMDDAMALTLVGLAISVVFRAQLFSLGAEGQIFLGGMMAGLVALYVPGLPPLLHILLCVAAACLTGFLLALIPGFLRAYLGANELVSTLMLNPLSILIFEYVLVQIKPAKENFLVSAQFPVSALLPRFVPPTRVSLGIIFVIVAVVLVWLLIQRTPLGYQIRMVGMNQKFARYGGINTKRTILLSMGISGLLAGLTGSYMALGIHQRLNMGLSVNLTIEGVVVAILARNNPLAVPAMALFYAYLRAGGQFMQSDAAVSLEIVRVIQAVIILLFTAERLGEFLNWRRKRQAEPTVA